MMAMIGGKDKKIIRDRTPIEFRDLLISVVVRTNREKQGCSLAGSISEQGCSLPLLPECNTPPAPAGARIGLGVAE